MANFAFAIEQVSISSSGVLPVNKEKSVEASISSDGRFITFLSNAKKLVDGITDIDSRYSTEFDFDIFVRDRQLGITERIPTSHSYYSGFSRYGHNARSSSKPVISDDGKFVVYEAQIRGAYGYEDFAIHVYNRESNRTTIASRGYGDSYSPSISANGQFIAFISEAIGLVDNDTNSKRDIFVYDTVAKITKRVSVSSQGEQSNEHSGKASISLNGRFIAFESAADNLVINDTNDQTDIFLHDLHTGQTTRVNVSSQGEQAIHPAFPSSTNPAVSADGKYVLFSSTAANLVDDDTNYRADLFIHDTQTGVTERVTVSSLGEQANDNTYQGSVSVDGRYITYVGSATNLISGDTNAASDVFVYDRLLGLTQRINAPPDGQESRLGVATDYASMSADGKFVVFDSFAQDISRIYDDSPPPYERLFGSDLFVTKNLFAMDFIGEPLLDQSSETGVYIWQDQSGRTFLKAVGGESQNGLQTRIAGTVIAQDSLSSINPISIEADALPNPDVLQAKGINRLEFELFIESSSEDSFSFVADTSKPLCVILSDVAGGLFLGPDKHQVGTAIDINRRISCDQQTVVSEGAPPINPGVNTGWFIWRVGDKWYNRFVAAGSSAKFEGRIVSLKSSGLSALNNIHAIPVSIEADDRFDQWPDNQLTFNLNVNVLEEDEFHFSMVNEANTCVQIQGSADYNIYLGPDRIEMPKSFSLETLLPCLQRPFKILGRPEVIDNGNRGIYIWENVNSQWEVEIAPGYGQWLSAVGVSSNKIIHDFEPVGLELSDEVFQTEKQINLLSGTGWGWRDGFTFKVEPDSQSCFYTKIADYHEIYIGPDKIPLGRYLYRYWNRAYGVSLDTFQPCPVDISDLDGDGVPDDFDVFPTDSDEYRDTDDDGIGNNADPDDDNDGVLDVDDDLHLDPTESIDTDGDRIGNNRDKDDDNDGVLDSDDVFPLNADEWHDSDNDGIGDNADYDDDNDGIPDVDDDFPLDPAESIDTDKDGIGNNRDKDDDNDGIPDVDDMYPLDHDNDGFDDVDDAFPDDPTEWLDTDKDGVGNNTDMDDDSDGIIDSVDNCPLKWNYYQSDEDSDGIGDVCEPIILAPILYLLLFDDEQ